MNIYIMTDLEGASGVWKDTQVFSENTSDYAYAKKCMARDVNTVVKTAFAEGATKIVVVDGHGPGCLDWDEVDPRVSLERPSLIAGHTFPSLDASFDCVFLIGQHAMAGTANAFLEHTQDSTRWFDYQLNGVSHGEISQLAAFAGHFEIPLVFVSGDRAACEECHRLFPEIITAEVKYAQERNAASCHPAEYCQNLLRDKTIESMTKVRAKKIAAWKPKKPILVELTLQRVAEADQRAKHKPLSKRVAPRTFQRSVDDARLIYDI